MRRRLGSLTSAARSKDAGERHTKCGTDLVRHCSSLLGSLRFSKNSDLMYCKQSVKTTHDYIQFLPMATTNCFSATTSATYSTEVAKCRVCTDQELAWVFIKETLLFLHRR